MFKIFGNAVAFIAFGLGVSVLTPNANAWNKGAGGCAPRWAQGEVQGCRGDCPLSTPRCAPVYPGDDTTKAPTGCRCYS